MVYFGIILGILAGITLVVLFVTYVCFRMTYYVSDKRRQPKTKYDIPPGSVYEPHREEMIAQIKEVDALPYREYTVTSFDGLQLWGKYYECTPGAPVELMFHGYRGSARRDLCGGVQRCFALGRNALIVDQRAGGKSQGKVISFGINESRDCLVWIDLLIRELGNDVKIMLTGISMGAATVMMAADKELPKNVVGILADCGYTSPEEIIKKVIREDMKLPAKVLFPFVKLGAKLYGGFDLTETSPLKALPNSKVPVMLVHGNDDDFVPCYMSEALYQVCADPKRLFIVCGAGHGLSYLEAPDDYLTTLAEFSDLCSIPATINRKPAKTEE